MFSSLKTISVAFALIVTSSSATIAQIKPPSGPLNAITIGPARLVKPECDEAAVPNGDSVVIPAGATDVEAPVTVNYENVGALDDLYPEGGGGADLYPLPCEGSIGGVLPTAATVGPTPNEIAAETFLAQAPATPPPPAVTGLPTFPAEMRHDCGIAVSATQTQIVSCQSPQFLMAGEPFEGRDIIYVHGLATEHLKRWLSNDSSVKQTWPADAAAFVGANGYFRTYATQYWADHIRENLFDILSPTNPIAGYQYLPGQAPTYKPKANRVLLVAWSSNQTIEYAQHTLIAQIRAAMISGTNVITPPRYPKQFRKRFCANGCILVSHSTGGEIISSAFGKAMANVYGLGGKDVVNSMRAHIAFQGAISGSRLATVAVALGTAGSVPSAAVQSVLCPIQDELFGFTNTCSLNTGFVTNSILRDLVPLVAQNVWGPWIAKSPVRTVTVAGGHPVGNYSGATPFFLPGLDDGVVSMNSACGNPAKVVTPVTAASGVNVSSFVKAFDMGVPGLRAIKLFRAQLSYRGPPPRNRYMAGGCTPYLSTTGMVMPLDDAMSGTFWDVRQRYPNHFSFIQGAIDHSHDGGTDNANKWPSELSNPASFPRRYLNYIGLENAEEMSAVTDNGIYHQFPDTTYLVHPGFSGQMREYKSGRYIKFRLFGKTRKIWIWKRTYHLLNNWESKASTHYVYEYVGRR